MKKVQPKTVFKNLYQNMFTIALSFQTQRA